MVGRGTKVGDAYIEVHGDNEEWVKSLKKLRKQWDKEWAEAGEGAGNKFGQAWQNAIEKSITGNRDLLARSGALQNFDSYVKKWGSLDEAVRRVEAGIKDLYEPSRKVNSITEEQYRNLLANFRAWERNRREAQATAEAAQEMKGSLASLDRSNQRLDKYWTTVRKQMRSTAELQKRMADQRVRSENEHWDAVRKHMKSHINLQEALAKSRDRAARERTAHLKQWFKYQNNGYKLLQKRLETQEKINARVAREAEQVEILAKKREANIEDAASRYRQLFDIREDLTSDEYSFIGEMVDRDLAGIEKVNQRLQRMYRDLEQRRKDQIDDISSYRIDETNRVVERVKETVDRHITTSRDKDSYLFSRLVGSRNDILNMVGKIITPFEKIGSRTFGALFSSIGSSIEKLSLRLASGGKFSRIFSRGLGGVARVAPAVGSAVGAAAVAIWAAVSALSAVASLISSVAGMIAGIASSLAYAVGGALASLAPILLAAASAATALAVGIHGMTDAQKAQLEPLEEWYDGVSRFVANNLFADLGKQVDGFLDVLGPHFREVLGASAESISNVVSSSIDAIGSANFQGVLDTLDTHIPDIVGNLGDAFSGLARGLVSVAAAIAPRVEEITGKIADALNSWAEWAATPEGQEQISQWFDDAVRSAKILYDVITTVIDIFGQLFSMGKDEGDSWIQGWADGLENFYNWLKSPEGQAAFERFMTNAQETASNLGNLVDAAANLFDTLDSPQGHAALQFIIGSLTTLFDAASKVVDIVNDVNQSLIDLFNIDTAEGRGGLMEDALGPLNNLLPEGFDLSEAWPTIESALGDVWDNIVNWFNNLDWSGIWDWMTTDFDWYTKVNTWLSELPGEIADWFESVDWSKELTDIGKWIIEGLIDGIVEALIPDKVEDAFQPVIDWVKGLFGISSPSTVFFDIGENIVQGLINGLLSLPSDLFDAAKSLVDTIGQAFDQNLPGIVNGALNIIDNLIPGLKGIMDDADSAAGKGLKRLDGTMTDGAKRSVEGFAEGFSSLSGKTRNELQRTNKVADRQMKQMRRDMRREASRIPGEVGDALRPLGLRVAEMAQRAQNAGSKNMQQMRDAMRNVANDVPGAVGSALSPLNDRVRAQANAAARAGAAGMRDARSRMAGIAATIDNYVGSALGSLYGEGYSVGASLGKGMAAGMKQSLRRVRSIAYQMGEAAERATRAATITQSPSKVYIDIGHNLGQGMVLGMTDYLGEIGRAATRMADATLKPFSNEDMYARGLSATNGLVDGLRRGTPGSVGVNQLIGGGPADGRGGTIIYPGAIVIQSNAKSPDILANKVMDRLSEEMAGA